MIAVLFIAIGLLLVIGMPIAFALGAGASIAILWEGTLPISIVAQRMFFGLDSWLLMAIPLFMLAGQLMASGGMSSRLVAFTTELFGFIRGSLGFVCVAASMTFAGVSGSSTADTAAVGSILLPLMQERGYDMRFATALQAAAGSIGPVIPPSLLMILIGFTTDTSVSALFLGGIVPGLMIGLGLMVVVYVHAARGGSAYLASRSDVDVRRVLRTGMAAAPALGMPVIILVGIVGGIFTTTEAAVVAVVYGLVVGMFVYREISLADLPRIIARSAELATVIMFIQTTAFLFAWLITVHQVPALLAQAFVSRVSGPGTFFLLYIPLLLLRRRGDGELLGHDRVAADRLPDRPEARRRPGSLRRRHHGWLGDRLRDAAVRGHAVRILQPHRKEHPRDNALYLADRRLDARGVAADNVLSRDRLVDPGDVRLIPRATSHTAAHVLRCAT